MTQTSKRLLVLALAAAFGRAAFAAPCTETYHIITTERDVVIDSVPLPQAVNLDIHTPGGVVVFQQSGPWALQCKLTSNGSIGITAPTLAVQPGASVEADGVMLATRPVDAAALKQGKMQYLGQAKGALTMAGSLDVGTAVLDGDKVSLSGRIALPGDGVVSVTAGQLAMVKSSAIQVAKLDNKGFDGRVTLMSPQPIVLDGDITVPTGKLAVYSDGVVSQRSPVSAGAFSAEAAEIRMPLENRIPLIGELSAKQGVVLQTTVDAMLLDTIKVSGQGGKVLIAGTRNLTLDSGAKIQVPGGVGDAVMLYAAGNLYDKANVSQAIQAGRGRWVLYQKDWEHTTVNPAAGVHRYNCTLDTCGSGSPALTTAGTKPVLAYSKQPTVTVAPLSYSRPVGADNPVWTTAGAPVQGVLPQDAGSLDVLDASRIAPCQGMAGECQMMSTYRVQGRPGRDAAAGKYPLTVAPILTSTLRYRIEYGTGTATVTAN